ncbi:MAG: amidohydrolase family protein [Burkholderiales bacterium]|nr:amidohydrolase family protein [Burkholderiales bacterium]
MRRTAVINARVFDAPRGVLIEAGSVVIEGETVVEVTSEPRDFADAQIIDAAGRVVLPGLIDAHVHVTAVSHDLLRLAAQPPSLITAQSKGVMEGMLQRGFTTVRDACGADFGLQEAVERGLFAGPRLFIAGWPITQTGGHADPRPKGAREMFCTCAGLGLYGAIADGVGEVRRAVREQVRNGANQIKVMAGGGIASPTDPIDGTQYSMEELRAICEEARAANLYVMAHAYSPQAVMRAVQAGVRSIEHGNLIDEASAKLLKQEGVWLVPTLATYAALADEGQRLGWSAAMLEKLARVRAKGIESIHLAKAHGVAIALGTDLLGAMHQRQSEEFSLRAAVLSPVEIVQSATISAARLMDQEGRIGSLARGAWADLLIVDGDPTRDVGVLSRPEVSLRLVMKAGKVVRNTLPTPAARTLSVP